MAPRLETATDQQQHTQIPLPLTPLSRNREIAASASAPRRAGGGARAGAFERGLVALAQYAEREGTVVVARSWSEELPDGTSVRLGVWLSNTRTRRAGLSAEQRGQLAALGVEWAEAEA
ncbi:helicase associated domain-containing protein [Streptomyces sp. NPDC045714]|uniref:helicase associated domain-containing protein n=1 Tax=Streptomyces sp. NPDC045714 TaxID=3154913 RepID=UPI0033C6C112